MDEFTTVFVFTDKAKEVFGVANRSLWDGIFIIAIGVVVLVLFIIQGRKKPLKLVGILFVLAWMVFWFGGSTGWISRSQEDHSRYNEEYQRLLDIYNNQQYRLQKALCKYNMLNSGEGMRQVMSSTSVESNLNSATIPLRLRTTRPSRTAVF